MDLAGPIVAHLISSDDLSWFREACLHPFPFAVFIPEGTPSNHHAEMEIGFVSSGRFARVFASTSVITHYFSLEHILRFDCYIMECFVLERSTTLRNIFL